MQTFQFVMDYVKLQHLLVQADMIRQLTVCLPAVD